jgi:hypothetical protein
MANFCMKCGGALDPGAAFCRQCGSQVSAAPPVQNAAPVYNAPTPPTGPPAKSSSAFKFLLIAFFVIVAFGMAAMVGVYYYAKGKVTDKMAEFKEQTGVDVGAALEKAARSKPSGEKRDGCLMLTKQEAEHILGIPLERVDGELRRGASEEHCDYYASAGAAKASADQVPDRLEKLKARSSGKDGEMKELEGVIKSLTAGMNDGSTPLLQVTIYRDDAQVAITGFNLGTALTGTKAERIEGPWDEARMGPLNSTMTVRKGDNGFMIDLRQLADGREKGLEISKVIAGRF